MNIRIEKDLKAKLEQMAKEEGRSLNNLVVHLLKCAVLSGETLRKLKIPIVKKLPKEDYDPSEDGLYKEKKK